MLKWLFSKMTGDIYSINMESMKLLQKNDLPDSFLDPDLKLKWLEEYFDKESFKMLKKMVSEKKKDKVLHCGVCSKKIGNAPIINCKICYIWYHIRCVKLKEIPDDSWFCNRC